MEKPNRGKSTKLLHQILDTVSYKEKSDNVTLFQLYPLINNPMTGGGGGEGGVDSIDDNFVAMKS